MAQPTLSEVHINRYMTNISVAFLQESTEFGAQRLFPPVPVDKASDVIAVYNRGDFNRDTMQVRGLSSESAGDGYNVNQTSAYNCQQWSLHHDIDDRIRANSDTPLAPDRDATLFLANKALIRKERFWASKFFTTSVWTGNCSGNGSSSSISNSGTFGYWDNNTSTPIEDVRAAKLQGLLNSGGMKFNVLGLAAPVWNVLADHPEIVDRVKYGQTGGSPGQIAQVTREAVAALLELEEIVVFDTIYNAAVEPGETSTLIFPNGALLAYRPKSPGLMTPSAGYTLNWTGLMNGLPNEMASDKDLGYAGVRIKTFRMEERQSDRVEIDAAFDMKVISADCGFFFNNCIQGTLN